MAFLCQETNCKMWADSECSCPKKLKLCGYHNLKHHEDFECNTRSLKKELHEGFTKVKETEGFLNQIKADLISTADNLISNILKSVYKGVNEIESKRQEVNEWMRMNEDKNMEDILGLFKYIKIKERSLKKSVKSIEKLLCLSELSKNELKAENYELKGQNSSIHMESEKIKLDFDELAKKIRDGNYNLVDYGKEMDDLKNFNVNLKKELMEKNKNIEGLNEKLKSELEYRVQQEQLKAKMINDQEELKSSKNKIEQEITKKREIEINEAKNREKALKEINDKLTDEAETLKSNVNQEKLKYEEYVKTIEKLIQENKKQIDNLNALLQKSEDEKNQHLQNVEQMREQERIRLNAKNEKARIKKEKQERLEQEKKREEDEKKMQDEAKNIDDEEKKNQGPGKFANMSLEEKHKHLQSLNLEWYTNIAIGTGNYQLKEVLFTNDGKYVFVCSI
ncbi:hypothetical protein SteCoe_132 [Stentor coeruleus]|uniref:Uncharacterized protein n=1 Tax=Stentor coeruleus TaxID=5963 RepID=A0A1R2D5A6_9CILI|nr:hypothetical protein SteCoe_132 [Stentor coeruleus]